MSKQTSNLADYILSLPQKVSSLRGQAANLFAQADQLATLLSGLDRAKLDNLTLTGNPKLDAALRLSMESSREWLSAFPEILEELGELEGRIAFWKEGGLMLVDLTSQSSCPLCLELVVLEVPPKPMLQIMPASGYFHNIPISIRIPARLLMAWNSNTWVMGMENCTNLSFAKYEFVKDRFRLQMVETNHRSDFPITTTFDLTRLIHSNWGTRNVHLAGIVLGEKAIAEHIDEWAAFVHSGYCMSAEAQKYYLDFLEEFRLAVLELAAAQPKNSGQ